MQIQDIVKINASTTEGAKPVSGKEEALFAEFTKTLDKIVTKLQKQDYSSSFANQTVEKKYTESKQQTEKPSIKATQDDIRRTEDKTKKLNLGASNQGKLVSKNSESSNDQNDKDTAKIRTEDSNDQTQTDKEERVNQSEESEADGTEQQETLSDTAVVSVQPTPQVLLSQKTTVKDEQTVGEEVEKSDLPSQSENLFGSELQQQSLAQPGEPIRQEKGISSTGIDNSSESLKTYKIAEGSTKQSPITTDGAEANQASIEVQNQAILAEEVNLAIPTVDSRIKQSEDPQSDRNISNLFEKLILARALNQASEDFSNMPQGQILMEQNLQNLMKSQLNQQVGKVLVNTASQNNIQSAQGLQNLVYQPQKGAENSQRGEMKEAMKTLKPQYEARTMERVESALKEVARAKDGKTISVRLDPPELGSLKIDVSLRDGSLHARVVAETPQVTTLLKEKSHELVQMMRKLGLNVEKVSVSVGDQKESFSGNLNGFDNSAQQFADQRSGSERRSTHSSGRSSVPGSSDVLGQLRSVTTAVDDHWVA